MHSNRQQHSAQTQTHSIINKPSLCFIKFINMRLSNQFRQHSQQPKTRLEILLKDEQKDISRGFSPQANRLNFYKHQKLAPYHFSGPQLTHKKIIQIQKERQHNLSVVLQERRRQYVENSDVDRHKDSNFEYIRQIDGIAHKKRARYYFKKQKEAIQQVYHIGVLTSQGIEEVKNQKQKISQSTQQVTIPQNRKFQDLDVEQMHFEMVRAQQKYKNILTQ